MITCIPDLLDLVELREITGLVREGAFVDGRTSAGYRAKRVKLNEQMARKDAAADKARDLVLAALSRNDTFRRVALPRSVQRPMISRYGVGMRYGRHVDDALMGKPTRVRTDLSVTVFLNGPDEYDGGELIIEVGEDEQAVKLPAGAAVVYPAGALHRVAEVSRGERLAGITWVQSVVRDAGQRELLADLDRVCRYLSRSVPESRETDLAYKTYSNLLRRWAEP